MLIAEAGDYFYLLSVFGVRFSIFASGIHYPINSNIIYMYQSREPLAGGVGDTPLNAQFTPDRIDSLGPDDIFVFGSNLQGRHGGGAARVALNRFGAIFGQGVGLQGNTYAIPTMQGGVETIKPYVDEFIDFAKSRPGLTFYVTKIGCGIAGFTFEEIAPLFSNAIGISNIRLPKEFVDIIESNQQ